MDTLFSLKVFRHVVQNGSFTRAADQLGISTAMASKHVSHLENTVQAKLLHRNSRNLHLTEAGEAYFRQCSYALDTLDTAARIAANGTDKPQGVLKIAMPQWFANPRISAWLAEYCRLYPDVSLDLHLSNRHIDLIAEGVDLALRVSNSPNPALIVRPLTEIEFFLIASPDYLARHGTPHTPEEAEKHLAVMSSYIDMGHLEILHPDGHTVNLSLRPYTRCDSTLMTRELIRGGMGIGYQPAWCTEEDIAAGTLVRLLPEYRIHTARLYAVYVDRTFLSAKVRSMIDFLSGKTAV